VWLLGVLPDDGNRLSGCDVVARRPVVVAGEGIEMVRDELLSMRKSVASAHGFMLSSRRLSTLPKSLHTRFFLAFYGAESSNAKVVHAFRSLFSTASLSIP